MELVKSHRPNPEMAAASEEKKVLATSDWALCEIDNI